MEEIQIQHPEQEILLQVKKSTSQKDSKCFNIKHINQGGSSNTASGTSNVVLGGDSNQATGGLSLAEIETYREDYKQLNHLLQQTSSTGSNTILGGSSNTASGSGNFIAGNF